MSHFLDLILGTSCISACFACFFSVEAACSVFWAVYNHCIDWTGGLDWAGGLAEIICKVVTCCDLQ